MKESVGSRENLHEIYTENNTCKGPGLHLFTGASDLACLPVPSN